MTPVTFLQDARSALRAVRRDLSLFLFSAAIVGIGIGATTSVYSVMAPLVLRPLPFEQPERLVWVSNDADDSAGMSDLTSRSINLRDFRAASSELEGLTGYFAFYEQLSANLMVDGRPERLVPLWVAQDFLDVLGVQPVVGRNFTAQEGIDDGPDVVILTHALWQRRFNADPQVVGQTVTLDNTPHEVVGVLPASFDFSSIFSPRVGIDFLEPFPISDQTDSWGNTLSMVGRMKPGSTVERVQAELDTIVQGLEQADPERWGLGARVSALQEKISRPFRRALYLLAAAAAAVMMIVCVNLSNLLLAKGPKRQREMAIRSSLGAPRSRLLTQLLVESSLLTLGGGVLGLLIATGVTRWVSSSAGIDIPMLESIRVDSAALMLSLALALIAGVVVGIVPALQASRHEQAEGLKSSNRGASSSRAGSRLRETLVVAEVAAALVLLVFGGLLLKSFQKVLDVEVGFDPSRVVAWELSPSRSFEELPQTNAYYEQVVAEVEQLPAVDAVALVDAVPLGINRTWGIAVPGNDDEELRNMNVFPHIVDHRYLQAMEIPLVSGRYLTQHDDGESQFVALINQTVQRTLFRGEDPLGRSIEVAGSSFEVVGVVGDVRHRSLEQGSDPEVYLPYTQLWAFVSLDMVVRSSLPVDSLAPSVASAIAAADPTLPNNDFTELAAMVDLSLSPRRFTLSVLMAFAATALLLAALGIYGVLSYSVSERRREIGIRMALGESSPGVLRRVLVRTLGLAAVGVALGGLAAFAVTRFASSLLFDVAPSDPLTYLLMSGTLLLVATLAGFVPALRAARTKSSLVLQAE